MRKFLLRRPGPPETSESDSDGASESDFSSNRSWPRVGARASPAAASPARRRRRPAGRRRQASLSDRRSRGLSDPGFGGGVSREATVETYGPEKLRRRVHFASKRACCRCWRRQVGPSARDSEPDLDGPARRRLGPWHAASTPSPPTAARRSETLLAPRRAHEPA